MRSSLYCSASRNGSSNRPLRTYGAQRGFKPEPGTALFSPWFANHKGRYD